MKPDMKLTVIPQRNAKIKIGTIAKEIEIHGPILMDGSKSKINANAAKNEASISACSRILFIKKLPSKNWKPQGRICKETPGPHTTNILDPTIPAQALPYRFKGSEQHGVVHSQHIAPPVVSFGLIELSP